MSYPYLVTFLPNVSKLCNMSESKVDLRAANNVVGIVNAHITATAPSGENIKTTSKIFIVEDIEEVYFSFNVMKGLRIVHTNFPVAGVKQNQHKCQHCVVAVVTASAKCYCLPRQPPSGPPAHLPLAPSPANIPEMSAWLLARYAPSTFNHCTHQPLPQMDGPPVEIYIVEGATPRKMSTPATIPLYWQEQVKADLKSDMTLGVIEKVEEPSEWCQRMVCVRRPDGRPRRTVDLQPLKKFCKREEWVTNTPAKQGRMVPKNS